MQRLEIFLLGSPHIKVGGDVVKLPRHKAVALVAYLAMTHQSHTRDALATLFWPESDQARARAALREVLSSLRRALGKDWLEIDREYVALKQAPNLWLDVDVFRWRIAACQQHAHLTIELCSVCLASLSEAALLYRDDFMAGFRLADTPDFTMWQSVQCEALRHELGAVFEQLAQRYGVQGALDTAIAYAQDWLMLDPLREAAHRLLMKLYHQAGKQAAALEQYNQCVRVLGKEFGISPQSETTQLYEAIREGKATCSDLFESGYSSWQQDLPLQPTYFVGRERELAAIERLVRNPDCRLLTLVGTAGTGKTRLAIQAILHMAATRGSHLFQDARFVPLAPLDSSDGMVAAIADALSFPLRGQADAKTQLLNYLRGKRVLLILDNFEHLMDGVGLVGDILATAPGIRLLITSRQRLNLKWEWLFEVQGLDIPQDGAGESDRNELSNIESYSAVQLFLQCVRRTCRGHELSQEVMPTVVQICRLLGGLPLGIELSAACIEFLSCQEIAQSIEHDLSLLSTSLRDVPERHRSLQAAFDHSWRLLTDEEKAIFCKLSVFRGGFRLKAAEQVAGASLQALISLIHKSFLMSSRKGRYEVIEVLRQYAAKKLADSPAEEEKAFERHAEYYAHFLDQQAGRLLSAEQMQALATIKDEIDNVRTAWDWMLTHEKHTAIHLTLAGLFNFYDMQGLVQEGEKILDRAVQHWRGLPGGNDGACQSKMLILGKLLSYQGAFLERLSRLDRARGLLEESLTIFRRLDAHHEMALPLHSLGTLWARFGNSAEAKRLLEEGMAVCQKYNDFSEMASCINALGHVFFFLLKDYAAAKTHYHRAYTLFQQLGDRRLAAFCLEGLSYVALTLGEFEEARRFASEGLTAHQDVGDKRGMGLHLNILGRAAEGLGLYAEAKHLHLAALACHKEVGNLWEIADGFTDLGSALCGLEDYAEAKACFRESWNMAKNAGLSPAMLKVCANLAIMLAAEKQHTTNIKALELASFVFHDVAAWPEEKVRARQTLESLKTELPASVVSSAMGEGQADDWLQLSDWVERYLLEADFAAGIAL